MGLFIDLVAFFLFFSLFVSVCVCFFMWFCLFSFAFTICFEVLYVLFLNFLLFLFVCFSFFFLPFLPCCVAGKVLLHQPGVGPEPPRWESRVQDVGPPETSWPHRILISESAPRDFCLKTKTQLQPRTSRLQCWTPNAKQLVRQEHNPNH